MVARRKEEVADWRYVMRIAHKSATVYDTTTRSTLEARWAIFFRELNLRWKYEPTTLHHEGCSYSPDFHVEGFGYVEIKPTLQLFITETSSRLARIAASYPDRLFYVFCSPHVSLDYAALYQGDKIFAPTPQQMYGKLSYARAGGDRLTIEAQNADIKRAAIIANTTKVNEWRSTKNVLLDVIDELARIYKR